MNTHSEQIKNPLVGKDFTALLVSCAIAGLLLKLPQWFDLGITDFVFYQKMGAWILFFGLSLFFLLKGHVTKLQNRLLSLLCFLIPGIYIFVLTPGGESQSIQLVYLHIPLLMCAFFGMVYIDFELNNKAKIAEFIRYLGDMIVLSCVILVAGALLLFLSIYLFKSIGYNFENLYMDYVTVWGIGATPILATYVVKKPTQGYKSAAALADIFNLLALLTLLAFLVALSLTSIDLRLDSPLLLTFNLMLIGVVLLILYSVSGFNNILKNRYRVTILILLCLVALIIDAFALYAVGFRIATFGVTPNKISVLGSNILFFVHLILILINLVRVLPNKSQSEKIIGTVILYIPVYLFWILFITFAFPLIFQMR
jgi:hypothetical protein